MQSGACRPRARSPAGLPLCQAAAASLAAHPTRAWPPLPTTKQVPELNPDGPVYAEYSTLPNDRAVRRGGTERR